MMTTLLHVLKQHQKFEKCSGTSIPNRTENGIYGRNRRWGEPMCGSKNLSRPVSKLPHLYLDEICRYLAERFCRWFKIPRVIYRIPGTDLLAFKLKMPEVVAVVPAAMVGELRAKRRWLVDTGARTGDCVAGFARGRRVEAVHIFRNPVRHAVICCWDTCCPSAACRSYGCVK